MEGPTATTYVLLSSSSSVSPWIGLIDADVNSSNEQKAKGLTGSGVTITAPKVKIVACKSGDATDGKKAKQG